MKNFIFNISAIMLIVIAYPLQASSLSIPNTFSAGSPAVAAEVNGNFSAAKTAVDDNDSRISLLETALATLQMTVSSQAATMTSLQNDLTAANNTVITLQTALAGKADANHNHDGTYSPTSHDHAGAYAPASHNHAQSDIGNLSSDLGTHSSQISAINNSEIMTLDPYITVANDSRGPIATLSGINLQLNNGAGTTNTINGLGNLIIGYDEQGTTSINRCSIGMNGTTQVNAANCLANGGTLSTTGFKTGSHYLVLGSENNYSSYGGLLAGLRNFSNSRYASVSGGAGNTASGYYSSVSGGYGNTASGVTASVSGGHSNTASERSASVSGGRSNTASSYYSSVSGGIGCTVGTQYAWGVGGTTTGCSANVTQ